jgi:hypothetical protein
VRRVGRAALDSASVRVYTDEASGGPLKTPRFAFAAVLLLSCAAGLSSAADGSDDVVAGFRAAAHVQVSAAAAEPSAAPAIAPAPAPAALSVNLLPQFADPSTRNQGGIGSCHAFGSVAVLEAAYDRKYGEHIELAEADVFLRRTVLSGDVYSQFCSSGKCEMVEGNDPAGDIRYVLEHGALTGGSYVRFADRYVKYRNAEQKTMEGIERTYQEESWLEKLMYDPRAHWKELSTQQGSKTILSSYLEGRGSMESTERDQIQKKFAGFRLRSKSDFDFKAEYKALAPKDCLAHGAIQRATVKAELDAHRPVCISMSLSGLSAWGQNDQTRDAYHAFMIIGYDSTSNGLVFHTRNSWGGDNPDIPDSQSCRIYEVDSVLTPNEKQTF